MVVFVAKAISAHTLPAVVASAKKLPPILKNTIAVNSKFLTRSIVSINGKDMDYSRSKVRNNNPVIYGIIEAKGKNESEKDISETNEIIIFLLVANMNGTTKMVIIYLLAHITLDL